MPNRTEARPAKAVLTYATGRLPLLRLFSTPLKTPWPKESKRKTPVERRNLACCGVSADHRFCMGRSALGDWQWTFTVVRLVAPPLDFSVPC